MFKVTDAVREQLVGSIGFIGASGAGKTLGMLKIAYGFISKKYPKLSDEAKWHKIGVIDTEHERSKIYAGTTSFGIDVGSFKHLDFEAPYTVERLDAAIKHLKDEHKVEIIIVDSTSHFWDGQGGILDLQQSFGGTFAAWQQTNPHYAHFVSLVTGEKYGIDMLNGMRAKQHYEVSQSEIGKLQVQKMGLKPVQRDSLEYEFHIVFNIDMDHIATPMKDNSGMFNTVPPAQIEQEYGEKLFLWLKEGKDVKAEEKAEKQPIIDSILAYKESKVPGMPDIATQMIDATVSKVGDLTNLKPEQLQRFATTLNNKEKELDKEIDKGVEELNKYAERSEAEALDAKLVKDLIPIAESFGIKGAKSMRKDALIKAIKKAQGK